MQDLNTFNDGLCDFIAASPTPFHAVATMARRLNEAGFQPLDEADDWSLSPGKYYVTRNGSSLVAFNLSDAPIERGWRMVGAHTDSPCLRVKPNPDMIVGEYYQLGVEIYGGVLLNPWFDRDLSLAGRVYYRSGNGQLAHALIDFRRPVAVVPNLAIHLDREANTNRTVNKQLHMPPILMTAGKVQGDFRQLLKQRLLEENPQADVQDVLDYELSFYDCQRPATVGLHNEFIAAARLDNLLSCYTGLRALVDGDNDENCLLVANDHEEVGSVSAVGAQGPMLESVLERLCGGRVQRDRAVLRSMMISADNAHGVHPNYVDKHDTNHGPIINRGPVIKVNANQRYATNSQTSSVFRAVCQQDNIPVQSFVVRADMGCGSTIGPATAAELGIPTLDIGVPTFAMHSIRELAGTDDAHYLYRALIAFNRLQSVA